MCAKNFSGNEIEYQNYRPEINLCGDVLWNHIMYITYKDASSLFTDLKLVT